MTSKERGGFLISASSIDCHRSWVAKDKQQELSAEVFFVVTLVSVAEATRRGKRKFRKVIILNSDNISPREALDSKKPDCGVTLVASARTTTREGVF